MARASRAALTVQAVVFGFDPDPGTPSTRALQVLTVRSGVPTADVERGETCAEAALRACTEAGLDLDGGRRGSRGHRSSLHLVGLGDEPGRGNRALVVQYYGTAPFGEITEGPGRWAAMGREPTPRLPAPDLRPADAHRYDLVGVPELVAQSPDTWVIGELADVVSIARSLADVCDLEVVHEVLDSTAGFAMLDGGTLAFSGRDGTRHWDALCTVIAKRWDEVVDAVDGVIRSPDVDAAALDAAATELSAAESAANLAATSD